MNMMAENRRVLVIGLDSATFDLIHPWSEEGLLPNLTKIMETGSFAPLASTLQPTTAPAWVTFMTGVNQGKHGLYDFVQRKAGSYNLEITSSVHVRAPFLFDYLGQQGQKVVALNIPYTYPPRPVNGVMIGGPFAPVVTRELVYPPTYYETLRQVVPDYFVLPDFNGRAKDPMADYAQQLLKGVELREKLSLHLMQTEPWDLFMVVFMAADEVQHTFWHCMAAAEGSPEAAYRHTIRQVYQRLDTAVGRLIAQAEADGDERETTVIVLSDHGAGEFRWMINLNRWLADFGYLHFLPPQRRGGRQWQAQLMQKLAVAYRNYVPADARATLRNRMGADRFSQMKEGFESKLLISNVDWQQTQVYSLGAGGNIFINLAGREPEGIVPPEAYEPLRKRLIEELMTLADPVTGEQVIKKVHKREELYAGPQLGNAPDLIIEWCDYACWGRGRYDHGDPVFQAQRSFDYSVQPLTGSHRQHGVLLAMGPHIRQGEIIAAPRLLDMAPTILAMLGLIPPDVMDGRILDELFTPDWQPPQQAVDTDSVAGGMFAYDAEDEEKITEHLRSLGYL
jgi:predicted AlkP superfamily phosphohydrolase/phosphomutase